MNILTTNYGIPQHLVKRAEEIEILLQDQFKKIEKIQENNQLWVLDCFREERIQPSHFAPTFGYGYDDVGRDKLASLFARIFKVRVYNLNLADFF